MLLLSHLFTRLENLSAQIEQNQTACISTIYYYYLLFPFSVLRQSKAWLTMPLLHFYAKNKSHHLPSLEFPASPLGRPQAGLEGHWSEPGSELTETPKNGKQGMKQHFIGFNDHLKWITTFLLPVYIKQERNHTWATAALCFFISSLKSSWSSSILDCRSFFSLCRRLSCSSSWKKKDMPKINRAGRQLLLQK